MIWLLQALPILLAAVLGAIIGAGVMMVRCCRWNTPLRCANARHCPQFTPLISDQRLCEASQRIETISQTIRSSQVQSE